MAIDELWWRAGVIYQVYPRSLQDSNGDGVGDLPGIQRRLPYFVALGVDAIWISPFYPSPMADFGYDVSNYTGVDPLFGTQADFDQLLGSAHAAGLRVILDFVPNHTSNQHPWFLESKSSRTNAKADWYLWRDPAPGDDKDGKPIPPNNWISNFGGSGWTFVPERGQFYYHSFLPQQPDLNWRNAQVKSAMFDALRFWLERGGRSADGWRGVDGFRMDVLWLLIKDAQFRDNPPNPDWKPGENEIWSLKSTYTANQPETLEIVEQMRALLNSYSTPGRERVLIGEIYLDIHDLVRYYGEDAKGAPHLLGAQMPFNFHLIQTAWQAPLIAALIRDYEAALPAGAWPNWVLGNHDQHRLRTRVGAEQARVAAMLILTLRGTPTLYYGDELGMPDASIEPGQVQDPAEKNQPGMGLGRDPERAPMPWDWSPNAGFTTPDAKTWLPFPQGWPEFTVEGESANPHSSLNLYRMLLALRRAHPALHGGTVSDVQAVNGVLTYTRSSDDGAHQFEIYLNLTSEPESVTCKNGKLVLNTFLDQTHNDVGGTLGLRPNEGVVIQIR
jgi:alpha-glucosidase